MVIVNSDNTDTYTTIQSYVIKSTIQAYVTQLVALTAIVWREYIP